MFAPSPFESASLLFTSLRHFARYCSKPFRMNTCKTLSKQTTLSAFRMNTCEKPRGEWVLWLTNIRKPFVLSGQRESKALYAEGKYLRRMAQGAETAEAGEEGVGLG